MGVETATLMAYAAVASAGATAYQALTAKKPEAPKIQPEVKTQDAKAPDEGRLRQKNASTALLGPLAGNASTLLTGPSGIDPNGLNLGKNTLLGE